MANGILRVDWTIGVGHNHDVVLLCPSLNSQGAGVSSSLAQRERLTAKPTLAKAKPSGRASPDDIIKARLIAESAKEVSQPDNYLYCSFQGTAFPLRIDTLMRFTRRSGVIPK